MINTKGQMSPNEAKQSERRAYGYFLAERIRVKVRRVTPR